MSPSELIGVTGCKPWARKALAEPVVLGVGS